MTTTNPLNIGGDAADPFYRYQMPALSIVYRGGRNHSKNTIITNLEEVVYSLSRTVEEVLRYLGTEIGTMGKYDVDNNRATLHGEFPTDRLQDVLELYIDTFVLCQTCGDPWTHYEVAGKNKTRLMLLSSCHACGAINPIDCDEQKVAKWIVSAMSRSVETKKKKKPKKKKDKNKEDN